MDFTKTKEIKTYIWRGRDKTGKIRTNEISAINEQLVRKHLQEQNIVPISVRKKPKPLYESKGRIKTRDIVSFSRQMSTMLKAGMPVTRALELIEEGIIKPIRLRELVQDLKETVESGSSFSDALSQHPLYFNDLYISLIRSGEESGTLEETINKVSTGLEKNETTKKKIKKAMTYPAMVVLFAIIVTTILLVKVIPVFADFFANFGAELPTITKIVVAASNTLRSKGLIILAILIFSTIAFFWYKKRNKRIQQATNKFAFKIPILGRILRQGSIARFSRTLSTLFESGVPLVNALYTTAPTTGSVIYEKATIEITKDVENGAQLNFAVQNTGQFDTFVIQMINIGEESGNLGEMLAKIADFYEEEVDYSIDNLTTLIEPLIIGFLAIVVGTLVIAMYMPIFMLGDIVG